MNRVNKYFEQDNDNKDIEPDVNNIEFIFVDKIEDIEKLTSDLNLKEIIDQKDIIDFYKSGHHPNKKNKTCVIVDCKNVSEYECEINKSIINLRNAHRITKNIIARLDKAIDGFFKKINLNEKYANLLKDSICLREKTFSRIMEIQEIISKQLYEVRMQEENNIIYYATEHNKFMAIPLNGIITLGEWVDLKQTIPMFGPCNDLNCNNCFNKKITSK